jgi:hypothetical protein
MSDPSSKATEPDPADLDALRAMRDYRPPTKLPKSAEVAWALYEAGGDALDDAALEQLRILLGRYDDLKDLTDAICGLAAFQAYVGEQLGDEATATQIAGLIQETAPRYVPFFERVVRAVDALGTEAKKVLGRFFGRNLEAQKRAPVHDAAAPEGTVPLRDLKPVAQPPPWAKRVKPK